MATFCLDPEKADMSGRSDASVLTQDCNPHRPSWRSFLHRKPKQDDRHSIRSMTSQDNAPRRRPRWNLGMLTDPDTDEVPGSVLLMPKAAPFNEPLGLPDHSRRPSTYSTTTGGAAALPPPSGSPPAAAEDVKRTTCGTFVLDPQPDDSPNDPLNWAVWRRDCALLSLGFYCMLGGGMTPILAAGFDQVAVDLAVSTPDVALTTGLYMLGLGLGSVVLSPTAILYGKRPVYLAAAVCFVLSCVWCALATSFASLVLARVFMGLSVASVECLPSATVAEIYFLHEKAYRLGIYTLLLLSGKNLVPLVSAAIIDARGWRWAFWVVAVVVAFAAGLLFFFVPETFWDRTPVPSTRSLSQTVRRFSVDLLRSAAGTRNNSVVEPHPARSRSVAYERSEGEQGLQEKTRASDSIHSLDEKTLASSDAASSSSSSSTTTPDLEYCLPGGPNIPVPPRPYEPGALERRVSFASPIPLSPTTTGTGTAAPMQRIVSNNAYTQHYATQPPKTFLQQLSPLSGRLRPDSWLRVAARPFVLFAYPAILWSTLIYSLSIGWLIVVSESISTIYVSRASYNFTPLQAGLVYISPFVGGILGTVVAGKLSDVCVRWLARRNGGVYEPEFRLVMALPIGLTTTIGLMGYGWSAAERDNWIVPTVFFGVLSFGCSLGSTTSITFAVDSYRQFAGEALVTLNFSKNILHGLVFSLFFNRWLESEGSKDVFVAIGGLQLACVLLTIPMYIYGKRARMWTVRMDFMAKL